jgi:hypothetical protein
LDSIIDMPFMKLGSPKLAAFVERFQITTNQRQRPRHATLVSPAPLNCSEITLIDDETPLI